MKYKIIEILTKVKEYEVEARSESEARWEVSAGFHEPKDIKQIRKIEVLNEVSDLQ